MGRTLFTFFSALSLLLCVTAWVLWVRSYRSPRFVYYDWIVTGPPVEVRSLHWWSDNGAMEVTFDRTIARSPARATGWLNEDRPRGFQQIHAARRPPLRGPTDGFHYRGLYEQNKPLELDVVVYSLGAPYWFLAVKTALSPALWLLRIGPRRLAARLKKGLCPACGYDLRATPDRCPECGTAKATA